MRDSGVAEGRAGSAARLVRAARACERRAMALSSASLGLPSPAPSAAAAEGGDTPSMESIAGPESI